MKILFISDNFPPEGNAPANRTYEHCKEWVKAGMDVTVITGQPNFPAGKLYRGYKNRLYQTEDYDGIRVVRVWTYITPNRGTIRRSLDYLSFCLSAFIASFFLKTDVIIATSPQLFTALCGYLVSKFKRKPWIMEVRDLWPESIRAVNASNNKRILRNLAKLVKFLYQKADRLVVVTDSFAKKIIDLGIDSRKISVIKNGAINDRYFAARRDPLLEAKYGLTNKYVVGYIGTHGLAHGLELILDAAKRIKDQNVHFLMVGDGAMKGRLEKQLKAMGLNNVTMVAAQSREDIPTYINLIDVAVVPLIRKKTFLTVLPSKIFESAACAKPILLGVEGEAAELIDQYQAGLCFEPENRIDFLAKLFVMKNDLSAYGQMKIGALQLASAFDRRKLAQSMLQIVLTTAHQKRGSSPASPTIVSQVSK